MGKARTGLGSLWLFLTMQSAAMAATPEPVEPTIDWATAAERAAAIEHITNAPAISQLDDAFVIPAGLFTPPAPVEKADGFERWQSYAEEARWQNVTYPEPQFDLLAALDALDASRSADPQAEAEDDPEAGWWVF
ncbi:MAG: hypothetical protein AB7O98_06185 [Hyphomonadaceae bacterium]